MLIKITFAEILNLMMRGSLASVSGIAKMMLLGVFILFSSLLFTGLGAALSNFIFDVSGMQIALGAELSGNSLNALKLMQTLQTIGIFIIPSFLAAYLFSDRPMSYLGFNGIGGNIVLKTFLIVLSSLPAINLLTSINQLIPMSDWMVEMEKTAERLTKAFLVTDSAWAYLVNIVMIAVLPAIGEELFFRGIIQRRLVEFTNSRWVGILVTAALFSAIHFQFQGFIPRFALGVAFGYLLELTGSIWVPIVAHFFNNAIATTGYMLLGIGAIDERIEKVGGLKDLWLLGVVSLMVTMVLIYAVKREYDRVSSEQTGDSVIQQR